MGSLFRPLLGLLWMLLLHVFGILLLPVLLLFSKAQECYFVFFYRLATIIWAESFAKARCLALNPLNSLESHDPLLRVKGALRVLEIGAGLGSNFKHVSRNIKYTNVDPNREFGSAFLDELRRHPKVELERWVHGYGEDMTELTSGHFDVVMFSYLLCSAKHGRRILAEAKRVLCKGGHLIFLEHVAYPKGTWQRLLQNIMNPLWTVFCCNCHLNRESEKLIESAGFSQVMTSYVHVPLGIVVGNQAFGIAVA